MTELEIWARIEEMLREYRCSGSGAGRCLYEGLLNLANELTSEFKVVNNGNPSQIRPTETQMGCGSEE